MSYKLGLVTLYVRNVAQEKAFYTDILGLQEVPEVSGPSFAFLCPASGTSIALQDATTLLAGSAGSPGGVELGFEVEDIDAVWNDWKARHVEVLTEVMDMGAGRFFRAKDPEGHYLNAYRLYKEVQNVREQYGM